MEGRQIKPRQWLQGSEVLERLGIPLFELIDLCREGVFVPRSEDGGWVTPAKSDRCVFCDVMVGGSCPLPRPVGVDLKCYYHSTDDKKRDLEHVFLESLYRVSEVDAYEQSQGLKSPLKEGRSLESKDLVDRDKEKSLHTTKKRRSWSCLGRYVQS